jgi:hypothetical protein
MLKNRVSMIAYCGINCFICKSYIATQSENPENLEKVAEELSKVYRAEVKPEYVVCDGCRINKRHSYFCKNSCKMRKCCIEKNYNSCIECFEFPCLELQFELDNNPEAGENLEKIKQETGI